MPPNMIVDAGGAYCYFTQTMWVEILCINIQLQNLIWWENDPQQRISKSSDQTKKIFEKNYHLKSQSTFSEASQTEWDKPLDFSNRISSFPLKFIKPRLLLSSHYDNVGVESCKAKLLVFF